MSNGNFYVMKTRTRLEQSCTRTLSKDKGNNQYKVFMNWFLEQDEQTRIVLDAWATELKKQFYGLGDGGVCELMYTASRHLVVNNLEESVR